MMYLGFVEKSSQCLNSIQALRDEKNLRFVSYFEKEIK